MNLELIDMGTDMHGFVEQLVNGKWVFVKELEINREYNFFSLIDGNRDYYNCITILSKSREFDCSEEGTNQMLKWELDGYWHNYITLSDLDNYPFWDSPFYDSREKKYITPKELLKDSSNLQLFRKELKDNSYRIVYWYDN